MAGYLPRRFTCPQAVTRPSSNRAKRWFNYVDRSQHADHYSMPPVPPPHPDVWYDLIKLILSRWWAWCNFTKTHCSFISNRIRLKLALIILQDWQSQILHVIIIHSRWQPWRPHTMHRLSLACLARDVISSLFALQFLHSYLLVGLQS